MKIIVKILDTPEDVDSSVTIVVDKINCPISMINKNNLIIIYDKDTGKALYNKVIEVKVYNKGKKILHCIPEDIVLISHSNQL